MLRELWNAGMGAGAGYVISNLCDVACSRPSAAWEPVNLNGACGGVGHALGQQVQMQWSCDQDASSKLAHLFDICIE